MTHKIAWCGLLTILVLMPVAVLAETGVIEGDEAKALLEERKETAAFLSQENKVFVLKKPNGESIDMPEEITVDAGEYLFITNDEEKVVHNVYDVTDHSWVLKKQLPKGVAAVKFSEPKTHQLRCAIHPKMKINVSVVEKEQRKESDE